MARYIFNQSGTVGNLTGGPVTTTTTTPNVTDSVLIFNETTSSISFDLRVGGSDVTSYTVDMFSAIGRHGDSSTVSVDGARVVMDGKATVKIVGLAAGAVTLNNVETAHRSSNVIGEHVYLNLAV